MVPNALIALVLSVAGADSYNPLARVAPKSAAVSKDFDIKDAARKRTIPIRVYLPESKAPAPVVLFSHGLGGSRANNRYLGDHWAGRGYVVVFVQHPGSDESVWKDAPLGKRMEVLKQQASAANFSLRAKDIPATLDALGVWNEEKGHPMVGRMDLTHVGMSGHSFGAVTTQAVGGQSYPLGITLTDPRIRAAVMMSPSPPRRGDPSASFGRVAIPWMLLTGTLDDSMAMSHTSPADRLKVFPALPPGRKYQLVLDGAEHSAFSERGLPGDRRKRNPNHHVAILAVTTAFWDAYLKDDAAAKSWLDSEKSVRGVLEAKDQWSKK